MPPLVIVQTNTLKEADKLADAINKKGMETAVVELGEITPAKKEKDKPVKKKKKVELKVPSPVELRTTLTEVKEELGTQALKDIFAAHNAKNLKTLAKVEWATCWAEAKNLLKEANEDLDDDDLDDDDDDDDELGGLEDELEDELEDDLDDDDDDDDELGGLEDELDDVVDLAEVKKLASKYSDKNGIDKQRKILAKFGIPTARSLGKADDEQLGKIAKALKKGL